MPTQKLRRKLPFVVLTVLTVLSISTFGFIINKKLSSKSRAGIDQSNTIILGGTPADPKEWDFMVMVVNLDKLELSRRNINNPQFDSPTYGNIEKCGGTLISPRLVLTARHCISEIETYAPLMLQSIAIVQESEDLILTQTVDDSRLVKVVEVLYFLDDFKSTYNNDIAILRLEKPLDANFPTIQGEDWNETYGDIDVSTAGWGSTGTGAFLDPPTTLLQLDLQTLSFFPALEKYLSAGYLLENIIPSEELLQKEQQKYLHLLFVNGLPAKGRVSICQGDSGGPLIFKSNGRKMVVGVAVHAYPCDNKNTPLIGAFVNVSKHPQISNIILEDEK